MALHTSVTLAILLLAYLVYRHIIFPAFISPLSKLPGAHPSAHILPVWLWWQTRSNRENRNIYLAHCRHDSALVRIGPNQVSMVSLEGLRKVYADVRYDRTEWYLLFRNYGNTPSLLSMLSGRPHAIRRRMLSHIYSKSYLLNSPDFQTLARVMLFQRLLPVLDGVAQRKGSVDMFAMVVASAAEFLSAYQVGTANCLDLVPDARAQHRTTYLVNCERKILGLRGHRLAAEELEDQCLEMCRATAGREATSADQKGVEVDQVEGEKSTSPVVFRQLLAALSASDFHPKDPENILRSVAAEVLDNLEAARVGMGVVLTYTMYLLSQHPETQTALRQELASLTIPLQYPFEGESISASTLRALDGLRVLDAVLMETMRLHAPVGHLPRYVPSSGVTLEGYFIPAGVAVSTSAYLLHRNSDAFPEAETWRPERWLGYPRTADQQAAPNMKNVGEDVERGSDADPRRWFWAFGSGGKMCIGNNLAMLVMKLILASVYTNFTTSVNDHEGMEQMDNLYGAPVGGKMMLNVHHASAA